MRNKGEWALRAQARVQSRLRYKKPRLFDYNNSARIILVILGVSATSVASPLAVEDNVEPTMDSLGQIYWVSFKENWSFM